MKTQALITSLRRVLFHHWFTVFFEMLCISWQLLPCSNSRPSKCHCYVRGVTFHLLFYLCMLGGRGGGHSRFSLRHLVWTAATALKHSWLVNDLRSGFTRESVGNYSSIFSDHKRSFNLFFVASSADSSLITVSCFLSERATPVVVKKMTRTSCGVLGEKKKIHWT